MTTEKKNRLWLWYFAFVLLASVGVAGFMIAFNLRLQLKPEQLEAAWEKWKQHGPRDYRMTYTKQMHGRDTADVFEVKVRAGQVEDVVMNRDIRLEPKLRPYHSMDRLFRDIESFLELDAKEGRKTYVVARFDEETGALRHFIRRVMGEQERLELTVQLEPLP